MTCATVADDRGLPRDSLARSSHLYLDWMTEHTYQQIKILQSVDFPRDTVQKNEKKRTKRRELQAKHTCDSELARAIEKVALITK